MRLDLDLPSLRGSDSSDLAPQIELRCTKILRQGTVLYASAQRDVYCPFADTCISTSRYFRMYYFANFSVVQTVHAVCDRTCEEHSIAILLRCRDQRAQ